MTNHEYLSILQKLHTTENERKLFIVLGVTCLSLGVICYLQIHARNTMSNTLHRQKVDLERTHEKLRDVVAQKSKLALDLSYHKSMLEGLKRDNQLLLNKLSESNENSTNA